MPAPSDAAGPAIWCGVGHRTARQPIATSANKMPEPIIKALAAKDTACRFYVRLPRQTIRRTVRDGIMENSQRRNAAADEVVAGVGKTARARSPMVRIAGSPRRRPIPASTSRPSALLYRAVIPTRHGGKPPQQGRPGWFPSDRHSRISKAIGNCPVQSSGRPRDPGTIAAAGSSILRREWRRWPSTPRSGQALTGPPVAALVKAEGCDNLQCEAWTARWSR